MEEGLSNGASGEPRKSGETRGFVRESGVLFDTSTHYPSKSGYMSAFFIFMVEASRTFPSMLPQINQQVDPLRSRFLVLVMNVRILIDIIRNIDCERLGLSFAFLLLPARNPCSRGFVG